MRTDLLSRTIRTTIILACVQLPIQWAISILLRHVTVLLKLDGFHGDVIRLQSQKSEVLRILIYTRLKINRK